MEDAGRVRVCHLIATNFYGGPEKQIVEHLKRLDPSRYEGIVCSFREGESENEILANAGRAGFETISVPMKGAFDIRALFILIRSLRKSRVGLLCLHGYKATVLGHFAGKVLSIPAVAFSRGYTAENAKVAFYEWLERRFIARQAGIVSVSEGQARKLNSLGVRPGRSWVVHNSVSVECAREESARSEPGLVKKEFGVPEGCALVVSSGRLSPEKGHRYLVEAIGMLGPSTKAVFVFCGEGPCLDRLKEQAERLGVSGKCRFPGFQRKILRIYNSMDFLVLPSLTEGLPNVVLEAFSFGKPVICTSVGGVPELVEDGLNGLLVEPENPQTLAKAVLRLIEDRQYGERLGEAGYRRVCESFTFEQQSSKLENIYSQVLAEAG